MDRTLPALFAGYRELRAVVDAVVEGHLGRVTREGGAARLSLGCYEVFGGDPGGEGARRLVAGAQRPRELVYGNDPAWRRLIQDVHGQAVYDRPMRDFEAGGLDGAKLARVAAALPEGFALRDLDVPLAEQLDADLEPHGLQVFPSAADLVERGLALGVISDDGQLACAATSYTVSSRYVEVAISTRPAFRGKGLAAAAAAAFLRRCLDRGLVPRWSASNPVSQRLAERLGYAPAGLCEVLYLR